MNISDMLKVREKSKNKGYVIPILYEQIIKESMVDSSKRRKDVFHPSEITYDIFCTREWVLCQRDLSLYEKGTFSIDQQRRFDAGKMYHDYIQDKLGNAGILFGIWKCLRKCDGDSCIHVGFKPKEDTYCKDAIWRYKEPTAYDDEFRIHGNTDGIIVINNEKFILEFKTMNNNGFSTLCSPAYSHEEQSLWYLDIISRKGFKEWNTMLAEDVLDEEVIERVMPIIEMPFKGSIIVYVNKDSQDYREYFADISLLDSKVVLLNDKENVADIIQAKKQRMKEALQHLKDGTLPDRLVQCDDSSARRAKRCRACNPCFKE